VVDEDEGIGCLKTVVEKWSGSLRGRVAYGVRKCQESGTDGSEESIQYNPQHDREELRIRYSVPVVTRERRLNIARYYSRMRLWC
jgi:hypothetical protein